MDCQQLDCRSLKPYAREIMNPLNQFTPGPWRLGLQPGPIIYGPLGEQIAGLRGSSLGYEETVANARLIAAAPDLLLALERLIHPMADDEDLSYARDCIANARGK